MQQTLTRVEVILSLDDVAAGVACFGAPLQDGHGIDEVSSGALGDGSQLEWLRARQARHIRSFARFMVAPRDCADSAPITDSAACADGYYAEARRVLERGPSMRGFRIANDIDRAWHHDALARVGARFKTEILRRLDAITDVGLVAVVAADDLADVDYAQAAERSEIAEEMEHLRSRIAELDMQRQRVAAATVFACEAT